MRKSSCVSSSLRARIATSLPEKQSHQLVGTEMSSFQLLKRFRTCPSRCWSTLKATSGAQPMPNSPTEGGWQLQFGASVRSDPSTEFRVWAPNLTDFAVHIL